MIKTIPQAIDDMAVSLGADPSAEIPTVAQALENVYTALGGDRTDLDTLVVSEVIDLVAPLIQGGGGGGGDFTVATVTMVNNSGTSISIEAATYWVGEGEYYTSGSIYADPNATTTTSVILYKGAGFGYVTTENPPTLIASGDIEIVDNVEVYITGDGTITINEA